MKISSNIRAARLSRGISQARLADLLGCHRQTVAHWEQGRRVPNLRWLQEIADALNTTPSKLLSEGMDPTHD